MTRHRKILLLDFLREGPLVEHSIDFQGVRLNIVEHRIGWDFKTAEVLVRSHDGYVDGFALSGIQKKAGIRSYSIMHPGYVLLMKAANKSPLYLADDIRDFFSDWTLQRILKEQPQLFLGRRALFHCAAVSPTIDKIEQAGANILAADALVMTGMPLLLRGQAQIEAFLRTGSAIRRWLRLDGVNPEKNTVKAVPHQRLSKWIRESDIFVSFGSLLDRMKSLDALEGKILVVDYLSAETRERLKAVDVAQVIEFIPRQIGPESIHSKQFSILTALLDQLRINEDSPLSFDEYVLQWIQQMEIKPNRLRSSSGIQRRCAFIIHPLSTGDLWKSPRLSRFQNAPKKVRDLTVAASARLPGFYYGQLTGAVSQATGQEVICDIYALAATPKALLEMDEQQVYKRLVQVCELAKKRGAALIGLGAYTKVIGDAGLTVSRRSPIPVTNGNSYSASTTLWGARVMVEKMGMTGTKTRAMVIGATGSIGRVSSLLVSLVVDELVLVATRPDKLLELRQEVLEVNPKIQVKVTSNPNIDLPRMDLVVTATSNQGGSILDIHQVKPGAVICDCSRPLDISAEDAALRPDVMVIESGEVLLPGDVSIDCDLGLPKPTVYACLAETVLLSMEGRYESFSISKQLSMEKVKEIYKIGNLHGATLSEIQGPNGVITDEMIENCRKLAIEKMKTWSKVPVSEESP